MTLKAEEILQINLVNWFKFTYPDFADDLHHVANERFITPRGGAEFNEGKKLKKMGVTAGFYDIFLAVPAGIYHGLLQEIKVVGGRISPEQKAFGEQKNKRGYLAVVTFGEQQSKDALMLYMNLMKQKPSS